MRSVMNKIVCTMVLAGTVCLAGSSYAASARPPSVEGHTVAFVARASNAHKLASVVIDQATPYSTLVAGPNTVDSTSVVCAKPTCTIAVSMFVQAGAQEDAGNQWGACALVDGNYANTCAYTGELPTDGTYVSTTERNTFSVTKGSHSVATVVFLTDAANLTAYDIQYEVLTP